MQAFDLEETVKTVVNVGEKSVEDYYYLKEFEGLQGRVVKVMHKPNLQYEVFFKNKERIGVFRHCELIKE
ncbi:MAG TPA: hypothetical protein K8V56_13660 [Sporosarcina psychrophila]|uniref:Uncharacterized protein n=1 Tax=Sporosarcina psychrophila TaxID=1476 RepID=A0A921KF45_SPOPS|nr:hypothetical protein [Sporosarcina psychrophila]